MKSVLPFAETPHGKLTPLAQDIHAAIWDRVGLAKVQEFVREWAASWVARDNAIQATAQEERRIAEQVLLKHSESLEITQEQCLDRLPELQEAFREPERPELPLPPSHWERSLSEKWAGLAAVHDVFDMTGDKLLPWPLPDDALAFVEWMGGEGGAYWGLMKAARELTDTDAEWIRAWLKDVTKAHGPGDAPPAAKAEDDRPPEAEGSTAGKGVAPRDAWFVEQYNARGTDTYHRPAKIHAKWDGMTARERAKICPDAPNKITKDGVAQAIKRALRKSDARKSSKPKPSPRKRA